MWRWKDSNEVEPRAHLYTFSLTPPFVNVPTSEYSFMPGGSRCKGRELWPCPTPPKSSCGWREGHQEYQGPAHRQASQWEWWWDWRSHWRFESFGSEELALCWLYGWWHQARQGPLSLAAQAPSSSPALDAPDPRCPTERYIETGGPWTSGAADATPSSILWRYAAWSDRCRVI